MNIKFWGVRGSIPTPLTPQQIQAKISAAIQRITEDDIKDNASRERFISSLPKWIYGTTGGNTPCIEVTSGKNKKIIFDAGSGIRALGKLGIPPEDRHYSIFFSHFHWDHIQGLPFFEAAYNPRSKLDIYSPFSDMEKYLKNQMVKPYYPVDWAAFTKNIEFFTLKGGKTETVEDLKISCAKMSHPGDSYSYRVEENGRSFVYATDVELRDEDFKPSYERNKVFKDADVLVLDSQYTVEEAARKPNWGHSAFCYAVDFAVAWNIKKLYLFHHEPTYDDRKLYSILESARWYSDYTTGGALKVYLAVEGMEIKL